MPDTFGAGWRPEDATAGRVLGHALPAYQVGVGPP